MKELSSAPENRHYINVMESLVAQEVARQLQDVPTRVRQYIKLEEVVTYALNRLPALYASSERGWQYQRQLAKRDMQRQIKDAVRQAIAAVQVDPIRLSQPIQLECQQEADAVLQALRSLFQIPDLNWAAALDRLRALQSSPTGGDDRAASPTAVWRPGTYGREVAWRDRRQPLTGQSAAAGNGAGAQAGWDNAQYHR